LANETKVVKDKLIQKEKQMRYFTRIALPILTILLTLIFSYTAGAQLAAVDKESLEERVREHLKEANVDLREEVNDLFLLADIYVDEGNDEDAVKLYHCDCFEFFHMLSSFLLFITFNHTSCSISPSRG